MSADWQALEKGPVRVLQQLLRSSAPRSPLVSPLWERRLLGSSTACTIWRTSFGATQTGHRLPEVLVETSLWTTRPPTENRLSHNYLCELPVRWVAPKPTTRSTNSADRRRPGSGEPTPTEIQGLALAERARLFTVMTYL